MTLSPPQGRRALVLLLPALLASPLKADMFTFSWDNDLFIGQDQGYTNGGYLAYLTNSAEDEDAPSTISAALRNKMSWFPGIGAGSDQHATSFSIAQLIVTPEDISRREPRETDLPYVGYLSLSSSLWSWNDETITGLGLHLGVVGPESGAESIQKWVHKATGSDRPRGWDSQLGTDVVGGVHAAHGRKLLQFGDQGEIEHQLSSVSSATISSFTTSARTGLIWRMGRNLPVNFIPDYSGASATMAMPGAFSESGSGWSIFVDVHGEYIAYSYIEDYARPYRFDESPFVGQFGVGGTWQWGDFLAALTLRATTGEGDRNKDNFSFGTLSLSWAL